VTASSAGDGVTSSGRGAWAEPAVDEVAPGVYRVPLPLPNDGLTAVNVYVLRGQGSVVLVDGGWSIPEARSRLTTSLQTLSLTPGDIRRFLVTHVHRDHYTQAIAIRRDFGTTVALGAGEQPALEAVRDPSQPPMEPQFKTLRLMGAAALADELAAAMAARGDEHDPDWELPDEWLVPGDLVTEVGRRLEVVETPGHTRGHVVFHDLENRLLFAGDHVLPQITPSIALEPVLSDNPLGQFLRSLALVRSRPDARLLPAHGPVTESVHQRVDELIDHHGRRLELTESACLAGATTGHEVARQLTWTRRERSLGDLDAFNRMLAIAETGAHLQLLAAQGRLRSDDVDGVRHYTAG
jgi:glyoxylase-like metal-dependent hydrolase (beta-lactamase superfamily II)